MTDTPAASEPSTKLMTLREYARYRGVSHVSVMRWVKAERIPIVVVNGNKYVDPEKADVQYKETAVTTAALKRQAEEMLDAQDTAEQSVPKPDGPNFARARALREGLTARLAQLELEERLGRLVEVDKVRLELFSMSRTIRNAYLALPDRVSSLLAAETDPQRIHDILTREITKILDNLVESGSF